MERIPVFLKRPKGLDEKSVSRCVKSLLSLELNHKKIEISGKNVLLKPNLLKPRDGLAVTSGEVILYSAEYLLNQGARVTVGDSPAFGNAQKVLRSMGIFERLLEMGAKIKNLSDPQKIRLPCGIFVGVSNDALNKDLIVNIPRLKVHCQMGITCGVKNLYGTVVGHRKALYHTLYGKDRLLFSRIIIEIARLFPRVITLVDASVSMHKDGPTGGSPIETAFFALSNSPFAVDTACYLILGVNEDQVPIWKVSRKMNIKGSRKEDILFPLLAPRDIILKESFRLTDGLEPITFNPFRLIKGRVKSLLKRI